MVFFIHLCAYRRLHQTKKHQLNPQRFVSNETCILSGSKNRSGNVHIDGWVQDCCNSIANALKLQQSCTKPSIIYPIKYAHCLEVNYFLLIMTLQWRHHGHDSISNHQPHDCFLNRLFRRRSKKTSKLRVTGLCAGNSAGTGEFPTQMASNAETVSIWWRHHERVRFISLYSSGLLHSQALGPDSISRYRLTSMGNPIVETRRS